MAEKEAQTESAQIKTMCKALKQKETSIKSIEEVIQKVTPWIKNAQDEIEFVRPLFNLLVEKELREIH